VPSAVIPAKLNLWIGWRTYERHLWDLAELEAARRVSACGDAHEVAATLLRLG
jgi:hypothetical protein